MSSKINSSEVRKSFFDIKSVAIIGASESEGKIGNTLIKNLANFEGEKFGVNPKGGEFEGIKFYENVEALPIVVDIAVIVIPAKFVITSLLEIAKKGIKRIIIISAGFKEVGDMESENKIKSIAKKYNISILGPNCLGYIDVYNNLNLSFGSKSVKAGNLAMISQSGAMAVAFTDWANMHELGFSKIISMGNKCDIGENEFLEELEQDENTKVIAIYLESIEDGKKFLKIASRISKKKPIILVKSGMSNRGMQAASSHTGALAGEAEIFKTAFLQAGIHYTSKLEDFLLWSKIFTNSSFFLSLGLKGKMSAGQIGIEELIIVTNAGGPGVMITDHAEEFGVKLTEFTTEEKEILKEGLPEAASVANPIDIIGDATSERYYKILENIKKLSKKRAILIMLTPQVITDSTKIAEIIVNFKKNNPDFYIMTSFMGDASLGESRKILNNKNILDFNYPQKALLAFSKILKQKEWETSHQPSPLGGEGVVHPEKIKKIKNILSSEKKLAGAESIEKIMKELDLPFVKNYLVKSEEEANIIFEKIGAKKLLARVSSEDIPHKTDVGGVVFDIKSNEDAKKAYNTILKNINKNVPQANIEGIIYSVFLEQTNELRKIFIGLKRDLTFGNVLIVGIGGIYVNIYEDVSKKILPISKGEIVEMFKELKGYPILKGYRGTKSVNFDKIAIIVNKLANLFENLGNIKEIDVNPLFSNSEENFLVDVKLYL